MIFILQYRIKIGQRTEYHGYNQMFHTFRRRDVSADIIRIKKTGHHGKEKGDAKDMGRVQFAENKTGHHGRGKGDATDMGRMQFAENKTGLRM